MFFRINIHLIDLGKSSDSDSAVVGWGLRFCISNRLPVDADAAL